MNVALAMAGLAMGVAASPHCALMCGSPCAAITGGRRQAGAAFHAGRVAGYMAGGAVAAMSVSAVGAWTRSAQLLQPLWTLLQLGLLGLGLWWLLAGRMPARTLRTGVTPIRFLRGRAPGACAAGLAWVAWPCGVLQGALLLSALASSAAGGALVMACFAVGSAPALAATPWLWARWHRLGGASASPGQVRAFGYRAAGAALAGTSAWALARTLQERIAALCLS